MKKHVTFGLLVAMAFVVAAQDTVRYPDPWYAYQDKGTLVRDSVLVNYMHVCEPGDITTYYSYIYPFPNRNHEWLYGVAVTLTDFDTFCNAPSDYTSMYIEVYRGVTKTRIMYQPGWEDAFWWDYTSRVFVQAGSLQTKQCMFEYEYDLPASAPTVVRCYEIYFNQPLEIEAEDTIFIGLPWYGKWGLLCAYDSTLLHRRPWLAYVEGPRVYDYDPRVFLWGGVFPIVGLRCTAPRGFRLCGTGVTAACWNSDTNATAFQVSVCDSLVEPELGSLATTQDTSFDLSHLHPDSAYMVYLRKMCSFVSADTVWSDWSGPIVIGDTTGWAARSAEGIAGAEAVEVTLMPNPATERVTVAAEGMECVEVLAVDGTILLRKDGLRQDACVLELNGLTAGVYMVRVATPRGTATRKLAVQ